MLAKRSLSSLTKFNRGLNSSLKRYKIEFSSGTPYNKRWQWKWKHAYFGSPREAEHTSVNKPEDANLSSPMWGTWILDWKNRIAPGIQTAYNRRTRMFDPFSTFVLPGSAGFFSLFWDFQFGFKFLSLFPLAVLYTRIRDKTLDPDLKETHFREQIHSNEEISELFDVDTMYVLDYDMEYDAGMPDFKEFPEFDNKFFKFFNTDTSMCTGHFTFGDVESGATMHIDFQTMPIAGEFRYQVGEPYFMFDAVAKITHNGVYKEVVMADREESLKKYRPYVFLY